MLVVYALYRAYSASYFFRPLDTLAPILPACRSSWRPDHHKLLAAGPGGFSVPLCTVAGCAPLSMPSLAC